jgi:uncharacterized surface protein with fasciclin (FAS1) repeats
MKSIFATPRALIATLALGLAAAPAMAEPPAWSDKSDLTIVESAVALSGGVLKFDDNQDDFDILVAAVLATGANEYPLNGEDDYTVFAPTDAAFLAAAGFDVAAGTTAEDEIAAVAILANALDLEAVLAYHITEGVRNSISVTNAKKIKMFDGNTITARDGFVDAIGSDADFVDTDIRVADGMIHVIDNVLLPFMLP